MYANDKRIYYVFEKTGGKVKPFNKILEINGANYQQNRVRNILASKKIKKTNR